MRKTSSIIGAAAVAGLLASGGAAFTDSNTFATSATQPLTGYASTTVSGGTIDSLKYNLSSDGSNVDTVSLVLAGNTGSSSVSIGFNGGATTSCGTGTYSSTNSQTSYTCDNSGSNFTQLTSGLTSTAVVIN